MVLVHASLWLWEPRPVALVAVVAVVDHKPVALVEVCLSGMGSVGQVWGDIDWVRA